MMEKWSSQTPYDTYICIQTSNCRISFADQDLMTAWNHVYQDDTWTSPAGEVCLYRLPVAGRFSHILVAGLDAMTDLQKLARQIGERLSKCNAHSVRIDGLHLLKDRSIQKQFLYTLFDSEYRYEKYFSKRLHDQTAETNVSCGRIYFSHDITAEDAREVLLLAESAAITKDLVNENSNTMTPEKIAQQCATLGDMHGWETTVYDEKNCAQFGMGLFLAVAAGSTHPPRFIIMRYQGGTGKPICLIGKGITYDSGGMSLKTVAMENMRYDMNGAATVIGVMTAIAQAKLPVNVTAVIAACENLTDAHSFRNGDVVRSMSGKSVYIANTDAEGRLTMADAVTYCIRYENPRKLLDIAGLTGSVYSFLGDLGGAVLSADDTFCTEWQRAADQAGEYYLTLPYRQKAKEFIRSPYADLSNMGSQATGISAGMFMQEFAEELPLLHVDLGAMPFTTSPKTGQWIGATAYGLTTLYYWIKQHSC